MPTPSFGAIKLLQKRTGADRALCKKALEEHDCNEDLAAAHIAATTSFVDSAAAPAPSSDGATITVVEDEPGLERLSVIRVEVGDGETFPSYGDTLAVQYRGTLLRTGVEFDSSYGRGRDFCFRVGMGKVIKGWDEGLMQMSLGEKAVLMVPASMAYGPQGNGPVPPNADLKFEVTLTKITPQTSCLGPGQRDSRKTHEYDAIAKQMLGMDSTPMDWRPPDEREQMPLTSQMPA